MSVVQKHKDEATVYVLYRPYYQEELTSTMRLPLQLRVLMIALLAVPALLPAQEYPDISRGKAVYERHCQTCHGEGGWGDGPAAAELKVAPADFHRFRSFLKSDEELLRSIEHGVVFSPMHAWRGQLTDGEMLDVLTHIGLLSQQAN